MMKVARSGTRTRTVSLPKDFKSPCNDPPALTTAIQNSLNRIVEHMIRSGERQFTPSFLGHLRKIYGKFPTVLPKDMHSYDLRTATCLVCRGGW